MRVHVGKITSNEDKKAISAKGKAILTQMVGEIQGYMTAIYFYSGFDLSQKFT